MLSYRLSTVNDVHLGFKPVFRYSKPHTSSTFFEEENEMHLLYKLHYVEDNKHLHSVKDTPKHSV